ncbi:pyridoxamine 5'-phosphate oxidase family protein [Nocardioides sp.]|uniref:pyridoxamine 5'-phosphate oxidase family protein n=1 Tax=Nocardioides sp. TaxID=35761 RepID=UPI003567E812
MDTLVELTAAECRDLLTTDTVGRVGFVTPHGPRIVPVNYVLRDDAIEIRTSPTSELATYGPGARIVVEFDHLDTERHRGWSVLVHGTCGPAEDHRNGDGRERDVGPVPWAGGERPIWLRVPLTELTGRRVGGPHWPHPVVSGRGRGY